MCSLFQGRPVLIACLFIIIQFFSINVSANKYIINDDNTLTPKEMAAINSKIKKISYQGPVESVSFIEAEGHRIYLHGYLNGIPIIAIQFWMSGGNADYQYLLVLDRKKQRIFGPLRIGGRGFRAISIYAINRQIDACVYYYGPNDPMPDPSVKGETGFDLTSHGIVESGAIVNIADADFPKGCIPRP